MPRVRAGGGDAMSSHVIADEQLDEFRRMISAYREEASRLGVERDVARGDATAYRATIAELTEALRCERVRVAELTGELELVTKAALGIAPQRRLCGLCLRYTATPLGERCECVYRWEVV